MIDKKRPYEPVPVKWMSCGRCTDFLQCYVNWTRRGVIQTHEQKYLLVHTEIHSLQKESVQS